MVINVCVSLILVRYLGHTGLALATTTAVTLTFPIYVRNLCKTLHLFDIRGRIITILKELFAAGVMLIVARMTSGLIGILALNGAIHFLVELIVSGCIGILCYLIMCYLLQVKECREIATLVSSKSMSKNDI